jgi:hypothetical protein
VEVNISALICTHVHTNTNAHAHTCTHAHMHACTHAQIHTLENKHTCVHTPAACDLCLGNPPTPTEGCIASSFRDRPSPLHSAARYEIKHWRFPSPGPDPAAPQSPPPLRLPNSIQQLAVLCTRGPWQLALSEGQFAAVVPEPFNGFPSSLDPARRFFKFAGLPNRRDRVCCSGGRNCPCRSKSEAVGAFLQVGPSVVTEPLRCQS